MQCADELFIKLNHEMYKWEFEWGTWYTTHVNSIIEVLKSQKCEQWYLFACIHLVNVFLHIFWCQFGGNKPWFKHQPNKPFACNENIQTYLPICYFQIFVKETFRKLFLDILIFTTNKGGKNINKAFAILSYLNWHK